MFGQAGLEAQLTTYTHYVYMKLVLVTVRLTELSSMTYFGRLFRFLPFLDQDEDHSMRNKIKRATQILLTLCSLFFLGGAGGGGGKKWVGVTVLLSVMAVFRPIRSSDFYSPRFLDPHLVSVLLTKQTCTKPKVDLGTDQLLTNTEKMHSDQGRVVGSPVKLTQD